MKGCRMNRFGIPYFTLQDCFNHHGLHYADRVALICGEDSITWGELNRRMNRVGNSLIQRGIGKGDKVCTLLPSAISTVEIMYGITKSGAAMVPLSALSQPETLRLLINDSDASAIFVGPEMEALIDPIRKKLINIKPGYFISVGFEKEGWVSYEDFTWEVSDKDPVVKYDNEDHGLILYTSGTTGTPKGALFTHCGRYIWTLELTAFFGITDTSKTLVSTPLYHSASMSIMQPTLLKGGTIIIIPQFDPEGWMKVAEKERPTHSFLVPTQFGVIMNHPKIRDYDIANFKCIFSTGSTLMPEMKKAIIKRFGNVLFEIYGNTEGISTCLDPANMLRKVASVGKPMHCMDFRIIDDSGQELPWGEYGEIIGFGTTMFRGYYKRRDLDEESMWMDKRGYTFIKTGDMGKYDEEGFLYIVDRKKDMIISGGVNIYASDIESVLKMHPDVVDAAVIAIPHQKWGETPLSLVIRREGSHVSEEDLKEWLNSRLAKYQQVSAIEFRKEFPRNALLKVIKKQLRDPYWNK
ncbi:class I adenylate-forming enzyme family protein [Desulfatitalea tepidiphila]|uniref:class I adenylate-forming enzyme family protein n=1 Tax=Desulfatitalea tepidiphila TaxID=1185843 RepID=UPI0009F94154